MSDREWIFTLVTIGVAGVAAFVLALRTPPGFERDLMGYAGLAAVAAVSLTLIGSIRSRGSRS